MGLEILVGLVIVVILARRFEADLRGLQELPGAGPRSDESPPSEESFVDTGDVEVPTVDQYGELR